MRKCDAERLTFDFQPMDWESLYHYALTTASKRRKTCLTPRSAMKRIRMEEADDQMDWSPAAETRKRRIPLTSRRVSKRIRLELNTAFAKEPAEKRKHSETSASTCKRTRLGLESPIIIRQPTVVISVDSTRPPMTRCEPVVTEEEPVAEVECVVPPRVYEILEDSVVEDSFKSFDSIESFRPVATSTPNGSVFEAPVEIANPAESLCAQHRPDVTLTPIGSVFEAPVEFVDSIESFCAQHRPIATSTPNSSFLVDDDDEDIFYTISDQPAADESLLLAYGCCDDTC